MSLLRLRVTEYFDSVVNQIDVFVETKIQTRETPEEWWNKRRDEQIEAIRQIEQACLGQVSRLERIDETDWKERVFVEYCFTVEYADMIFVARANRYVQPDEIDLLKMRLKWIELTDKQMMRYFTCNQNVPVTLVQADFVSDTYGMFEKPWPIVNIDSWLNECRDVKRLEIETWACQTKSPFELNNEIRIQEFCIDFKYEEDVTVWNQIVDYYTNIDRIDRVKIKCSYYKKCSKPLSYLKSIGENTRLDTIIQVQHESCQENIPLFSDLIEYQHLTSLGLEKPNTVNFFRIKNWKSITKLGLGITLQRLETIDFTEFVSLNFLEISVRFDEDHVSNNRLTSRVFSRMRNIKELRFGFYSDERIELDDQEDLFNGLSQLRKLDMSGHFFKSKRTLDLPMLEKLTISFKASSQRSTIIAPEFKLPSLMALRLYSYCQAGESLSEFLASFTGTLNAKRVEIFGVDLNRASRECLRGFRKCEQLTLRLSESSSLSNEILCEFDNLVQLDIEFPAQASMHRDALRNLVNLREAIFQYYYPEMKPFDHKDKSIFDGLYSLAQIGFRCFNSRNKTREAFVFYENLNRHILVTFD